MKTLNEFGNYLRDAKRAVHNFHIGQSQNRKPKIFCIGRNKTGTTSLKSAAEDLGLVVGDQPTAELLFADYLKRDFKKIIEYCYSAEFFQDVPFSLPYTYPILNDAFPNSKFILSVRDSPEQWYESLIRFQIKINGVNGQLPDKEMLLKNNRVFLGFAYWIKNDAYRTPDNDIFNKELLLAHYINYNNEVRHYFRFKKNFLELNVGNSEDYVRFCDFINVNPKSDKFPWENRTS